MQSRHFAFAIGAVTAVAVGSVVAVSPGGAGPGDGSRHAACTPTWSTISGPTVQDGTLHAVDALSATHAWAVGGIVRHRIGEEDVLTSPLIERWNGRRWSVVASPKVRGALTDVAATSRRDAWAVGVERTGGYDESYNETGLMLHWDGRSWSRVELPFTVGGLTSISALSADDAWAVGDVWTGTESVGQILHWDGNRWALIADRRNAHLNDVTAISKRDVWAVGAEWVSWYKALALHWDGARWRAFMPKGADWLGAVAGLRGGDVWAGGFAQEEEMSPGAINPILFHWNGKRWVFVGVQSVDWTGFAAIAPVSPREAWATSENQADYGNDGGVGSWVWHRAGGRWQASELATGWTLTGISVAPTRGLEPLVWAVGQIGTEPKGWDGFFPAHTTPLIRRYGC